MQRRLAAAAVVMALLASAALASYWTLPRTALSRSPEDVDHVTLYQNGLAAITLVRPFEAAGGDQVLTLSLPTTTIFDSLHVEGEGVTVKELRSSLAADPALHPGDRLVLHMDDSSKLAGEYQGQQGNQILLSREGGTVLASLDHITAVEVTGRKVDPSGPGSTSVSILVQAAAGPRTVRVSYLAQGSGWTPNYVLDPTTGRMTFFATLAGLQDWRNVTLDLVAGNPNLVYAPTAGGMGGLAFSEAVARDDAYQVSFEPSQSMGALRRYHLPGTVDLARGETVRLPVVAGRVEMLRHYFQADGGAYPAEWTGLPEKYELRNTLGEALPSGPVRVYIDGAWVGADTLPALGKGESGNITVAVTDEVKARTVAVEERRSEPINTQYGRRMQRVTTTYELEVRNLRADGVDLRAVFTAHEGPTTKVLRTVPSPDHRLGTQHVWDQELGPGETLRHRVTVETEQDVYN